MGGAAFAPLLEKIELAESGKVAVGGIAHDFELLLHLAVRHRATRDGEFEDGFLPFIEFLQHGLGQAFGGGGGGLDPAEVFARAGKSQDEAVFVEGDVRDFQPVIKHGPPHAPDAGAAFFHEPEKHEALAEERIAGAGTRFALLQAFQRRVTHRQAGVGNDDAVEENFDDDMLARIFVVAVSECVDKGFAEGGLRILGQFEAIESNNAWVRRVFLRMNETAVSMASGTLPRMDSATRASSSSIAPLPKP